MTTQGLLLKRSTSALTSVVADWLTPKRLRVYPLAIAAVTLTAWGVNWVVRPTLDGTPRYTIIGGDFLAAYTGGRFLLDGRLHELYDFGAQVAFQRRLIASATNSIPPFVYPPYNTAFYALFSGAGYVWGLVGWLAAGLLALIVAVRLFRGSMLANEASSTTRLLLVCFLFIPTVEWFLYGQSSAFSLLLYTLVFVLLRRRRDSAAGFFVGLLLYKPQLAIGLGLLLLVQRRWRALLGAALGAGLWVGIGFVLSPAAMLAFSRFAAQLAELQRPRMWGEHSLYFFAVLLLDGLWKSGANLAAVMMTGGGCLLLVLWWWGREWRPGSRSWDLQMAATFALGLLVSPHLYWYDLMLLLLPLGIVWSHFRLTSHGGVLDAGHLLIWTTALFISTWLSSYATLVMLKLTGAVGLPVMGLQISVPIILGWALAVHREALTPANGSEPRAVSVFIRPD